MNTNQRPKTKKKLLLPLHPENGLVAQWIEQQPSKLWVAGSNPAGITKLSLEF